MKHIHLLIVALALLLLALLSTCGQPVIGLLFLTLISCAINKPQARLCAVTLSVPEILQDVLKAFRVETPEIFAPGGFGIDLSSKTAVLGDTITAKLSHVPLTGNYDANNGGFLNAMQDVTTLIEDIPISLNRFPIITIKFPWLTRASSKLDPNYKLWLAGAGQALALNVFAQIMAEAATNVSTEVPFPLVSANLDAWEETVRGQLNGQKADARTRRAFVSIPIASALGVDDRVRSSLFYGQLNREQGYRIWYNLAGFQTIREVPQITDSGIDGLAFDHRLVGLAIRGLETPGKLADELKIPKVMEFFETIDYESRLSLTAALWQEPGTADVFLSVGLLLGLHVGNGGGAAGTMTDYAGCRLHAQ